MYGLLSPVNGLLTWSRKDKQINIHTHTLFGKQFQETGHMSGLKIYGLNKEVVFPWKVIIHLKGYLA